MRAMPSLFLGSHTAVDFLNTWMAPQGVPIEHIGDGRAFVSWLVEAGLLDAVVAARARRRFGAAALDEAAAQARALREWARSWLPRWREAPAGPWEAELRQLNGWLARGLRHAELVVGDAGPALVDRYRFDKADELVALPAAQIARLITAEEPALLKPCAGPSCTLWFLDRTKAHRRLFCSATACGNRAKVAAFRERQRLRSKW
jgi:predicted RNA-binding Zn ribbon-like protein